MKALVTGCAGFIGSHLTAALLDKGVPVVGVDGFTDYYARSIKEHNLDENRRRPGFRFVETALQDADLAALLDGVTHVFHLAAQCVPTAPVGPTPSSPSTNGHHVAPLIRRTSAFRSERRKVSSAVTR